MSDYEKALALHLRDVGYRDSVAVLGVTEERVKQALDDLGLKLVSKQTWERLMRYMDLEQVIELNE